MSKIQTDADKQNLIRLQVIKLRGDIDKLFTGYNGDVILPVLLECLKSMYDALKTNKAEATFWFYLNQAFNLGWFGEPQVAAGEEKPKPKLTLTDMPAKIQVCKVKGCGNQVEANDLCKEHMADGT